MNIQQFQCNDPNLKVYFLSYYLVEGLDNDRSKFRVFPGNNSVLSLGWNSLPKRINGTTVIETNPDACYSIFFDTITRPFSFEYRGPAYELSILIRPEFTAFFTKRLTSLTRERKVWNKVIQNLQQRVFDTNDPVQRQHFIESWLRETLLGAQQESTDVVAAVGVTMKFLDKGMSIQSIASIIGTSRKTIHKVFKAHTMRTPSSYQRIGRFRRAMQVSKRESLTELAYTSGYYDQSHMVRDFRRLSGLTPRHLLSKILYLEQGSEVFWLPVLK